MRALASPVLVLVPVLLAGMAGCGHRPPYGIGQRPAAEQLLDHARPQLAALTVSEANVTINRVARADLAMLAEAPARFRGTVTKAGNELVSLAFSEQGYDLRYKLDQIPQGYYQGPPDPCAIQAMLGVPLSGEGLVSIVLGGAPMLDPPYELVDQQWDRRHGFEKLVVRNDAYIQELRFAWVGGQWRFSGAGLWRRSPDGAQPADLLWTFDHDRHRPVGPAVLPGRTRIRAPGRRRDSLVVIAYQRRDPAPKWATAPSADGGSTAGGDTGADDGWEDTGDGWENDEGGWENDEGGWENDEGGSTSDPPEPPAQVREPESPPSRPQEVVRIPAVFRLDGAGLPDRGDLCRSRAP